MVSFPCPVFPCFPPTRCLHFPECLLLHGPHLEASMSASAVSVVTGTLFLTTYCADPVRFIFSFNYHFSPRKYVLLFPFYR